MTKILGNNNLINFQSNRLRQYNNSSISSIKDHAELLNNKSLKQLYPLEIERADCNQKNKGLLGVLVELYHFGIIPNNSPMPDFPKANLELKVTGINKKNKAKERLTLSMIDYNEFVNQKFENFLQKVGNILLIFYKYDKTLNYEDMKFLFNHILIFKNLPEIDIEIIKQDWRKIIDKIKAGKAHELSGRDTNYLKADRKGASGSMQTQPYSTIKAKTRAFCFPGTYITHLIEPNMNYKQIISLDEIKKNSFEEIFEKKISKFYNIQLDRLFQDFKIPPSKQMNNILCKKIIKSILGLEKNQESLELKKADISMKTVRINSKGINPQHMSFPYYKFTELIKENIWEESKFYSFVSKKFMFVVFIEDKSSGWMIDKVKYYHLSSNELNECKKVWNKMKTVLQSGEIIKGIRDDGVRLNNFPKSTENSISHVRPKGTNRDDEFDLPTKDKMTGKNKFTKQCFWLHKKFINKISLN